MHRRAAAGRGMLAAFALLAVAVAMLANAGGVLDRLEAQSVDARFALRGPVPADQVAVVAIDGESITRLGRWPFSRRHHARAIDALRRAGVRTIAYDVQFTEPSGDDAADEALFAAVDRAPRIVLSTTEVDDAGRTNVLGGEDALAAIGARAANTSVPVGQGGVVRRVPYAVDGLTTFAVAAAETATGGPVDRTRFGRGGGALIDYHGPPGTVPTYRFADLLDGRVDPAKLRGRVVVVGASAPSLQDVHPVPTATDRLMAGPEVQAAAISTVLRNVPLRDLPGWAASLVIVALALVVPAAAALRVRPLRAGVLALAVLAGWLVACLAAFEHAGLVLPAAEPALALLAGAVGALGGGAVLEARERRHMRFLFGRFVPETVVDALLDREDAAGGIAGVRQDASVLFCDLRGFTAFAEHAEPELVIDVLNEYLGEMSEALLGHGGTVVSYQGDGIMAVFGSPVERPDHAAVALAAAEELIDVRLARVNAWLAERDLPPFELGVGVNSGAVMSGTVGSARRMEYAAVGDTTNVAARLQAATKGTPYALYVSSATYERLPDEGRERLTGGGELAMDGRERPVPVWTRARAAGRRLRVA